MDVAVASSDVSKAPAYARDLRVTVVFDTLGNPIAVFQQITDTEILTYTAKDDGFAEFVNSLEFINRMKGMRK